MQPELQGKWTREWSTSAVRPVSHRPVSGLPSPELLCLEGDGSEEGGEEEQQRGVMVVMPGFSARGRAWEGQGGPRRQMDGWGCLIYFLSTFQLRSNKPRVNLITLICKLDEFLHVCPLYKQLPEPIWQQPLPR